MRDLVNINVFLQETLKVRCLNKVTAVEAAKWLNDAGLLKDSESKPGLPLRKLLREGKIVGQNQEPNKRWFIYREDI